MDKRLVVVFLVLVAGGFVALTFLNKKAPPPAAAPVASEEVGGVAPDRTLRHALEQVTAVRHEVEGDGFVASVSNLGATFSSVTMAREQYAQVPNEDRPSPLPAESRGAIPERFYGAGPLELVTTWDPSSYPFRITFDSFQYAGTLRRVLRPEVEGGRVDPARPDVFDGAEAGPGFAGTYPPVQPGDRLEILAPAELASPTARTIKEVRGDRQITVDPPFAATAPVAGIRYRIVTEGPLPAIFERDQRFTLVQKDATSLVYVWPDPQVDESALFIERRLAVSGAYTIDTDIYVHNFGKDEIREQLTLVVQAFQPPVSGGGMFSGPPLNEYTAMCRAGGDSHRATARTLVEEKGKPEWSPPGEVAWVAVESRYFMLAALPLNLTNGQCRLEAFETRPAFGVVQAKVARTQSFAVPPVVDTCLPEWLPPRDGRAKCSELLARLGLKDGAGAQEIEAAYDRLRKSLTGDALEAAKAARIGLTGRRAARHSFRLYMGPKDLDQLQAVGSDLDEAIDFWVVGIIAKPMVMALRFFHGLIPHWGIAIILLTILVKLILFPITQKSFRSMRGMQKVKPEMDKLREKYGTNKQKLNEEMMALYKRHKVNPLGGCLPMLLQMPVYIALYRAIYSSVELFQAPLFGWVTDLSAPDPYFVLPIILGASMFVQQKLTPTSMDAAQARMMTWVMPIMFTALMLFLPSGLVLYIFVNTLLSLAQQLYINRSDPMPPTKATPAKA